MLWLSNVQSIVYRYLAISAGIIAWYSSYLICRIHVLAGTVNSSDPEAIARAEETYIANLIYAADKCAQVITS